MFRSISAVFVIGILIAGAHNSNGYKWIASKLGDPIPEKAVRLSPASNTTYVGRAKHYNLVLPAEVNSKGAVMLHLSMTVLKSDYEVLVAEENCEWRSEVSKGIVRAGTAWNGEPIFIGRTLGYDYPIVPIFLSTNQFSSVKYVTDIMYLICYDRDRWVDSESSNIPSNSVRGGEAFDNNEMFVARLLGPTSFIPGQVKPAIGIASAVYKGYEMKSSHCQVLVGDVDEYEWKHAELGAIPDYAVVADMDNKKELIYVARNVFLRTLTYVTFLEAFSQRSEYEILVKVQK